jgi:GntR family transcriptional regulator
MDLTTFPPAEIDETSDRPVYKQIADWLRRLIDEQYVKPGQQLPSESDLMKHFGRARLTVRRAFDLLATEGRVRAERGKGVFVKEVVRDDALVREPYDRLARYHYRDEGRSGVYIDALSQGLGEDAIRQDRVQLGEVGAPDRIAKKLHIEPGTTVFRRERRIRLGKAPTQLTTTFLPLELAIGALREEDTGDGGTAARIEELGYRLTHFIENLQVRMPSPYEGRALRLETGVPVVDLIQTTYAGDKPVECFTAVIAGDRYVFKYSVDA